MQFVVVLVDKDQQQHIQTFKTIFIRSANNVEQGGQRDQMEHRRERCATATAANRTIVCPPQTWTLSNRLLEFGPSVLRWWYVLL